ncbi:MAG: hypothetical protein IJE78_16475, partial [Bacteroidaceae bacterium]|nr:hypothetical protein [Bacteroidaceae bacterium]
GQAPALCKSKVFGVTRNVLSYSKHTLLCSGEHKNPSGTDWEVSLLPPSDESEGQALSLGCKIMAI